MNEKNIVKKVMSSLTLPRWFGRIRNKKKKIVSNDLNETGDSEGYKLQGRGLQSCSTRSLPGTPAKNPMVVLLLINRKDFTFLGVKICLKVSPILVFERDHFRKSCIIKFE